MANKGKPTSAIAPLSLACNGHSWQSDRQVCLSHRSCRDCNRHPTAVPEQVEVEVHVEGAQLLMTLVKVPSCVSVAMAPSSHSKAMVGATPLAQAAYVEYCFTFTVDGRAAVVCNAMLGAVLTQLLC